MRVKKEKIIVYCGFGIFILPETSKVNKDIPQGLQDSLYETYIKSSLMGGHFCLWVQSQVD